jgi:hypothetical protein
MAIRAWDGDFNAAREAATRLEPFGYDPQRAAVAALAGNTREFERIRDSRPKDWNPMWTTDLLISMPTKEPITSEMLSAADQMVKSDPANIEKRCIWAIAQFRANRLREALAELEALAVSSQRPESAPVLALIHHQLGNQSQARRRLNQSELWMTWRRAAGSKPGGCVIQPGIVDEAILLRTAVLHREAKQRIEGSGKTQIAAGLKPQPAPAAKPETKPANAPVPKPPVAQAAPAEKPKEKKEKK